MEDNRHIEDIKKESYGIISSTEKKRREFVKEVKELLLRYIDLITIEVDSPSEAKKNDIQRAKIHKEIAKKLRVKPGELNEFLHHLDDFVYDEDWLGKKKLNDYRVGSLGWKMTIKNIDLKEELKFTEKEKIFIQIADNFHDISPKIGSLKNYLSAFDRRVKNKYKPFFQRLEQMVCDLYEQSFQEMLEDVKILENEMRKIKNNPSKYFKKVENKEDIETRKTYMKGFFISIEKIREYISKIISLYEKINL